MCIYIRMLKSKQQEIVQKIVKGTTVIGAFKNVFNPLWPELFFPSIFEI